VLVLARNKGTLTPFFFLNSTHASKGAQVIVVVVMQQEGKL